MHLIPGDMFELTCPLILWKEPNYVGAPSSRSMLRQITGAVLIVATANSHAQQFSLLDPQHWYFVITGDLRMGWLPLSENNVGVCGLHKV